MTSAIKTICYRLFSTSSQYINVGESPACNCIKAGARSEKLVLDIGEQIDPENRWEVGHKNKWKNEVPSLESFH